jgi:hypothetical protein
VRNKRNRWVGGSDFASSKAVADLEIAVVNSKPLNSVQATLFAIAVPRYLQLNQVFKGCYWGLCNSTVAIQTAHHQKCCIC